MATIAENLQTIKDSTAAIKQSIINKGGEISGNITTWASAIDAIETGGGGGVVEEALENDVNFYDYDGFRVASFTIEEAKALTQEQYDAILPPTHEGLTFQEWNWTLEDIHTYDRQYADIGANYITTDGNTHINVAIDYATVGISLSGKNGTIYIDWGDGSEESSYTFPSYKYGMNFSHNYSTTSNKTITFRFQQKTEDGCYGFNIVGDRSVWQGISIAEILIGAYFNASGIVGKLNFIPRNQVLITIPTYMNDSISVTNTSFKQMSFPRNSIFVASYQCFAYNFGKVCFPKVVKSIAASNYIFYNCNYDKIVIPAYTDDVTISEGAFGGLFVRFISLPACAKFAVKTAGDYINSSFLVYVDIAQGWTPNVNMKFSTSTKWEKHYIVKFFNKLGTTTNAITLTFGATNLDKLTEEEKAIATNKGYTLA
jgi:hypothetical protein